jgi:hypothetical protein
MYSLQAWRTARDQLAARVGVVPSNLAINPRRTLKLQTKESDDGTCPYPECRFVVT